MLTAIGLQLRQRLDASDQLPPALATLVAHIDTEEAEPGGSKLEEPQGKECEAA